jgi:hypothetical protein
VKAKFGCKVGYVKATRPGVVPARGEAGWALANKHLAVTHATLVTSEAGVNAELIFKQTLSWNLGCAPACRALFASVCGHTLGP